MSDTAAITNPAAPADPNSTRRGWLAVASIALGTFALVTSEFIPIGVLPSMARDLHASVGSAGLLVTITGITAAVAAPPLAIAAGKLDRRLVMLVMTGLIILSNVIVLVSSVFVVTLAARILLGIGSAGFWVIGISLGARLVPERYSTYAMAMINAGISVGTVLGLPVGALIGHTLGWRWAFAGVAGLAAIVFLIQLVALPSVAAARALRPRDIISVLAGHRAQVGMTASILVHISQFAAYTFITPFLQQVAGFSATRSTVLLLVFGAIGVVGNVIAGGTIRRHVTATLVIDSIGIGATLLLLAALGSSSIAVIILLVIWGLAWGGVDVTTQTWMIRAHPESPESAIAVFVSLSELSLGLGALIGGVAVDVSGITAAYVVAGIFAVAAVAAITFLVTLHRRRGSGAAPAAPSTATPSNAAPSNAAPSTAAPSTAGAASQPG